MLNLGTSFQLDLDPGIALATLTDDCELHIVILPMSLCLCHSPALCLTPFIVPSTLTSFTVPADETHSHSMMLLKPIFYSGR